MRIVLEVSLRFSYSCMLSIVFQYFTLIYLLTYLFTQLAFVRFRMHVNRNRFLSKNINHSVTLPRSL